MALTETLHLTCGLKNATNGMDIFPSQTIEFSKVEGIGKEIVIDSSHPTGHTYDLSDLSDIDFIYMTCVFYETNSLTGAVEGEPAPFEIRYSTATHNNQNLPLKGLVTIPFGEALQALRVSTTSSDKVQIRLYANCKTV